MTAALDLDRALVVGLGITGAAVLDALTRRGMHPLAGDDHPSPEARRRAESSGVTLLESPSVDGWNEFSSAVRP